MQNNIDVLQQIISLADFSAMDSILYHHYIFADLSFVILGFIHPTLLLLIGFQIKNKPLEILLYANVIITVLLISVFKFNNDKIQIEKRTNLNEQQITLLKIIHDPKVIQAMNYNVARYGKNLYAIKKSLSETNETLEEIKQEEESFKEKQQFVNPTKFLELKIN